jgi:tetratricopeptide (TPR) repeat protein
VGQLEEGAREFREGLRLDPNATLSYANLARNYLDLNRLGEAKAVIDEAVAHKLDHPALHDCLVFDDS